MTSWVQAFVRLFIQHSFALRCSFTRSFVHNKSLKFLWEVPYAHIHDLEQPPPYKITKPGSDLRTYVRIEMDVHISLVINYVQCRRLIKIELMCNYFRSCLRLMYLPSTTGWT